MTRGRGCNRGMFGAVEGFQFLEHHHVNQVSMLVGGYLNDCTTAGRLQSAVEFLETASGVASPRLE
ncbi:MAG: hypothetical protein MI741_14395, partial [Rhodospirillales bacterium]|nr:hypothetical protein [Rhodospirillales bacterium]